MQEIYQTHVQLGIDQQSRPTVSLIIPTLNEASNLPLVLPYLPMNWIDEVILVDGRSTDNTVEVAKRFLPPIKVILEPRKGKGIAMRTGYEASHGDILIVLDADGSNDPREIPRYVTALLEGADLAKGSRFAHGGGTTDMPRFRMLGNGFFVYLANLLFNVHFTDLCYGYHAFWRTSLNRIKLEDYSGFEIDTALYLQAVKARLHVVEVPSFEGYRFYGTSNLQTFPDGLRVLKTILHQWKEWLMAQEKQLPLGFRGIRYAPPDMFATNRLLQSRTENVNEILDMIEVLSILIVAGHDTRKALNHFLKLTLEEFKADSGTVILLDENRHILDSCLVSNERSNPVELSNPSDVLEHGVAGWVVMNRKPVLILDTSKDPRWSRREWDKGNRSALSLPLSMGSAVVGALTLVRSKQNQFNLNDFDLLKKINPQQPFIAPNDLADSTWSFR